MSKTSSHFQKRSSWGRDSQKEVFLALVSRLLNTALDYQELLRAVAELLAPELGAWCLVDMFERSGRDRRLLTLVATEGAGTCAGLPQFRRRLEAVLRLGDTWSGALQTAAQGAQWCAIVPLGARGEVLGALSAGRTTGPFDHEELALLEEVARQTAVAAHSAELVAKLKQSCEARAELLAVVSHELKNPLTAIRGYMDLMGLVGAKGEHKPAELSRCLTHMGNAVTRMERLIGDLLDSERIELGHLSIERGHVEIMEFLEEITRNFASEAAKRNVRLRSAGMGGASIFCDRQRVLQVLANLVSNALKFTPPGGEVRLEASLTGLCEARFLVADSGPGLPPEYQSKVFDRYWQAKPLSRAGAGLGLYIAKGIVEAHGGRIWVESTPGQGSSFYFTIPANA